MYVTHSSVFELIISCQISKVEFVSVLRLHTDSMWSNSILQLFAQFSGFIIQLQHVPQQ